MNLVSFRDFLNLLSCLLSELNKLPCKKDGIFYIGRNFYTISVSYVSYYISSSYMNADFYISIYYTYIIHLHIINEYIGTLIVFVIGSVFSIIAYVYLFSKKNMWNLLEDGVRGQRGRGQKWRRGGKGRERAYVYFYELFEIKETFLMIGIEPKD